jgi:LPS-assembly protein
VKKILIVFFLFLIPSGYAYGRTVIRADSIISSKEEEKITADGNVEFVKNNYKIISEKIFLNRRDKKISFGGKTKLMDATGNNVFAESGEMSDDASFGTFNDAGILLNSGVTIISPSIEKRNERYSIKRCKFYFCKENNLSMSDPYSVIKKNVKKLNRQPISLYSFKSTIDREKEKIYFNHVFVRFFNVPIFYLPYFSTSAGFRKNVSGLSTPKILNDGNYGFGVELPYNLFLLEDNLRIGVVPTVYAKRRNAALNNKISYRNNNFFTELNYAAVFDRRASKNLKNLRMETEETEGVGRNYRDYANFRAEHKISDKFFYFVDFRDAGDRYILRDYFGNYDEFLNSNFLLFRGFNEYDFIKFSGLRTATIREKTDEAVLDNPQYVANAEYFLNRKIYRGERKSFDFNFDGAANTVFDEDRNELDRLSTDFNFNYSQLLGDLFLEAGVDAYHDKYAYLLDKRGGLGDDGNRTITDINLNLDYNFHYKNFAATPIFQYYYNNNSKRSGIFTDKDSKNSIFNITNIFSGNRYSGYDLYETGSRVNYGLELSMLSSNYNFELTTAQGYRSNVDKSHPIENFGENFSDILGGFNIISLDNNFSLSYLNIIDKNSSEIVRQDFILDFLYKKLELEMGYALLDRIDEVGGGKISERQLNLLAKYELGGGFKIGLELNNDLEKKKMTVLKTNLIFEENCLALELSAKRYNYVDSVDQNGWNFNLSMRINN